MGDRGPKVEGGGIGGLRGNVVDQGLKVEKLFTSMKRIRSSEFADRSMTKQRDQRFHYKGISRGS